MIVWMVMVEIIVVVAVMGAVLKVDTMCNDDKVRG